MNIDNLEMKCKKAILAISDNVKDINHKITYFIENYRDDYYKTQDGVKYLDRY